MTETTLPPQQQEHQPGKQTELEPQPRADRERGRAGTDLGAADSRHVCDRASYISGQTLHVNGGTVVTG